MYGRQNVGNVYRQIFLEYCRPICYIVNKKGTTAHKGLTSKEYLYRIATPSLAKVPGWFFYALKHYFKFANTNVSNARMNIPKAIRSLKSNGFLSISITPILCRIEVSHPATRLFLSIYYHKRRQRTISISVSPGTPADRRPCRSKVAFCYLCSGVSPCEPA